VRTLFGRVLALLVLLLAVLGWRDEQLLERQFGFSTAWALTGIAATLLSVAAIVVCRSLKVTMGIAALAGCGVAASAWWPAGVAGDPNEYTPAITGLGAGVVMGTAAIAALLVAGRQATTQSSA
jgi:hypothetical protein